MAQIAIAVEVINGDLLEWVGRAEALRVAQWAASLAAAVAFLLWFRACRRNAELLAPGLVRYDPSWAVGAWFVPPLMFWRPRRIALGIWEASAPGAGAAMRYLVNTWWVAWLAPFALDWGPLLWPARYGHHLAVDWLLRSFPDLLAGILLVVLIERVTRAQSYRSPLR